MAWVKFTLVTVLAFGASLADATCNSILWGSSSSGKATEMDYLAREAIYERTATHVAHNLELFARSRYGAEVGPHVLARLRAADPSLTALILDPGVVEQLDKFENFLEQHPRLENEAAWNVRRRFRDFLGYEIVYRGLALDEIEAIQIEVSQNISSTLLRTGGKSTTTDFYLAAAPLDRQYQRHVNGRGSSTLDLINPLISVTQYRDVAVAVANDFANERPGAKVYLLKLRIPRLDLLGFGKSQAGHGLNSGQKLIVEKFWMPPAVFEDDARLESMVLNRISGQEVVAIDEISGPARTIRFRWLDREKL